MRWAVLISLTAAILAIQIAAGAYRAERGNYSDEAAHFMNGLLLRDYVTRAPGRSPIAYAQDYYLHYPKIAPAMWPPVFHLTLGIFLLPGWPPHAAALFLVGLIAALTAWRLHLLFDRSGVVSLIVPLLFVTAPIVVAMSTAVMVDGLVALLSLEATYWLARHIDTTGRRDALLFGLFAALCCATKGNGVAVLLVVPIALLLTGRLDLLRRRDLYLAAAIVIVTAMPLLAISSHFDGRNGDFAPTGIGDASLRLWFYGRVLWAQLGAAGALIAAAGIWRVMARQRSSALPGAMPAALVSLLASALAFHIATWHTAIDARYMTMAVAPLVALLPLGAEHFGVNVGQWRINRGSMTACAAAALVLVAIQSRAGVRQPLGYRVVADWLDANHGLAGSRVLVVSDEAGEGALVAEAAARAALPEPTIIRGSKLLDDSDWNGHDERLLYKSPAEILPTLEALHVDFVVLDDAAVRSGELPYGADVTGVLEGRADRVEPVFHTTPGPRPAPSRPIRVFHLRYHAPGPPAPLRIDLGHTLGWTLER